MRLYRALPFAAMFLLAVSTAFADGGGDGAPKMGAGGPGSPSCSTFQSSADSNGDINAECTVTGDVPETTIIFAAPANETSSNPDTLGLSCTAPLLTAIGWTQNPNQQVTINGTVVDECSFTAPTLKTVTLSDVANAAWESIADNTGDCNCNWADFILGIPVGCDVTVTTQGDPSTELFAANAAFDVAPTQSDVLPFPEPGTLWLLAFGVVALVLFQRRQAKRALA